MLFPYLGYINDAAATNAGMHTSSQVSVFVWHIFLNCIHLLTIRRLKKIEQRFDKLDDENGNCYIKACEYPVLSRNLPLSKDLFLIRYDHHGAVQSRIRRIWDSITSSLLTLLNEDKNVYPYRNEDNHTYTDCVRSLSCHVQALDKNFFNFFLTEVLFPLCYYETKI